MPVPQWNADIITPDNEASAVIISGGGLVKDETGAVGVSVDGKFIELNNNGEITLSDFILESLNIRPTMPTEVPEGYVRVRYRSTLPSGINSNTGYYYADHFGVVDLKQSVLSSATPPSYLKDPYYFDIIGGVLTNITTGGKMCKFTGATGLLTVSGLSLSSAAYNSNAIFKDCTNLESVSMDTTGLQSATDMFMGCTSLKQVPLLNTDSLVYVSSSSSSTPNGMFRGCINVETGALALYQQMSAQATPPTTYTYCFMDCGSNTVTGAAELAQIPTSWGGTME